MKKEKKVVVFWIFVIGLIFFQQVEGKKMDKKKSIIDISMGVRIEGQYSLYKYWEMKVGNNRKACLKYVKYSKEWPPKENYKDEEIKVEFTISAEDYNNLILLYQKANFFEVKINDLNKNKKKPYITDVGTTTLWCKSDDKYRKISYGYVQDENLKNIVSYYYSIIAKHIPEEKK